MSLSKVILDRDGFQLQYWDEKIYKTIAMDLEEFFCYWNREIIIQNDVVLSDLTKQLVKLSPEKIKLIEQLAEISHLNDFIQECNKFSAVEGEEDKSTLERIEIYKDVGFEIFEKKRVLLYHHSAYGVAIDGTVYGISFTSMQRLKNLKLVLKTENDINEIDLDDPKSAYEKLIVQSNVTFTLGEFLYGLFDEICFHGSPERRDQRLQELENTVEEYHNRKGEEKE